MDSQLKKLVAKERRKNQVDEERLAQNVSALNREIDEQQAIRQRFAREHPLEWARYCHAKRYVDAPPLPPSQARGIAVGQDRGRAPRAATNGHRRGSRRGERSRSSSSDDPDPDPEPRVCECGCGASLEHLNADARVLSTACRGRVFRRRKAERALKVAEEVVAKRHKLWTLTNLADRANGAVKDRAALDRAIADCTEQLARAEQEVGHEALPIELRLCGCASPIRYYDEGGDPCCFRCSRFLAAPTGNDHGVS